MDPSTEEKLLSALESGDFQTALQILPKGDSSQLTLGPEQLTPLHYACQHEEVGIAIQLITEYNYSIESCTTTGQTPLHIAAKYGQLDVVKALVTLTTDVSLPDTPGNGASRCTRGTSTFNPSVEDDNGDTPLHIAAANGGNGHMETVKFFTEEKGCDPLFRDKYGDTPLHTAALGGSLNVNKFFINEKQCNPMSRGQFGRTPLHCASQEGHLHLVKYLIDECHTDPSCQDENGTTPLHLASKYGHMETVKFFTEEKGCDPLFRNKYGDTSLHTAALGGCLAVVKFFINEKQCNPMNRSQWGRTPLHHASQNGHLHLAKYLIDGCHTDPSCQDEDGVTPLHLASKYGHNMETVKFFTEEKGCDPLFRNKNGNTPLHTAALGGSLAVVKFFINEKQCNPMSRGQWGRTPLHDASQEGHLHLVKYLIDECHTDPSCQDENGTTPLHLASQYGHMETVKFFTEEKGCDPLFRNKNGNTPLHTAALGGSLNVNKFFINEKQCNPMSRGQFGRTPLHCASQEGHLHLVKYLIDECHTDPSCQDENGTTPLHLASKYGHMETVKFFTEEKGCDPLFRNKYGDTSLHTAALGGSLNVIKFFINEKQCNPMSRGQFGRTPLHDASQKGHLHLAKYLIDGCHTDPSCQDEDGVTPLHLASQYGHNMETVKFFTEEKGCDPLFRDKYGDTSLHTAALGGSLNVIKFFINEKQCNPMSRGQWGTTPLHVASQEGHLHLVKYLIDECHTDPSCQDENGFTPLHIASKNGHMETVKFFTEEKGCDPLFRNKNGNTPLHYAALGGSLNVIKFFINEKQCNPMSRGQWGRTPLHVASQEGHLQLAKYLIDECHTDPSCQDENGFTPLHIASKNGHMETVKFLISNAGCDPVCTNDIGRTPLQFALNYGEIEVAYYLISKGASISADQHLTLRSLKPWAPLYPIVKIYVVGNHATGKTTLISALQEETRSWLSMFYGRNIQVIATKTAGIIPTAFSSDLYGDVTLYDFTGHKEYYASHEVVFENISHPLILIAVDLSMSNSKIKKALMYWQSLIANAIPAERFAHAIAVGTHADLLTSKDLSTKAAILSETMKCSKFQAAGWTTLDCRNPSSAGMSKLRQMIQKSCKLLRIQVEFDYKNGSILNAYLTTRLSRISACTANELLRKLSARVLRHPSPLLEPLKSPTLLFQTCESLNISGHTLFLKNKENPEESWIVLNQEVILSTVHGLLELIKVSNKTGIVPLSHIQGLLAAEISIDLALRYMQQMEFCSEIDPQALNLIANFHQSFWERVWKRYFSRQESHFFFPSLISAERPNDVWEPDQEYIHTSGWCLKCTESNHFFTPRFLHVLLIRLARQFALRPHLTTLELSEGCRLWKNGIHWLDPKGIEAIVELTDQSTVVTVMMRCNEQGESRFVELRSSVIGQVLSNVSRFCREVKLEEHLLHPQCLDVFPVQEPLELPIVQIAMALIQEDPHIVLGDCFSSTAKHPFLSLERLLYFEPYQHLKIQFIAKLFNEKNGWNLVPKDALYELAIAFCEKWKLLAIILNTPPEEIKELEQDNSRSDLQKCMKVLTSWSARDQRPPSSSDGPSPPGGSYASLRCALDKYSIFAGRNPVVRPLYCMLFLPM